MLLVIGFLRSTGVFTSERVLRVLVVSAALSSVNCDGRLQRSTQLAHFSSLREGSRSNARPHLVPCHLFSPLGNPMLMVSRFPSQFKELLE
jgi:hypothetical protein